MTTPLNFAVFRVVNLERVRRWHPGFPADANWSGADWSNAMCGEAGEAANVVKKMRRWETGASNAGDPGQIELATDLAMELADTVTYADLLAAYYGIDLGTAVAVKFNIVSKRQGFPERLPES